MTRLLDPTRERQREYDRRYHDRRRKGIPALKPAFAIDQQTGCWVWQRALRGTISGPGTGYANMSKKGLGHRVYYKRYIGPIPDGLQLDHLCRNTRCVNPLHLEPVTARENTLRGDSIAARYAARTHCKHGHEFTPENTTVVNGSRRCHRCQRRWSRAA